MQHHAVEQPRDRNKRDCERACQLGDFKEVHAQLLRIPRLGTLRRRAEMRNASARRSFFRAALRGSKQLQRVEQARQQFKSGLRRRPSGLSPGGASHPRSYHAGPPGSPWSSAASGTLCCRLLIQSAALVHRASMAAFESSLRSERSGVLVQTLRRAVQRLDDLFQCFAVRIGRGGRFAGRAGRLPGVQIEAALGELDCELESPFGRRRRFEERDGVVERVQPLAVPVELVDVVGQAAALVLVSCSAPRGTVAARRAGSPRGASGV